MNPRECPSCGSYFCDGVRCYLEDDEEAYIPPQLSEEARADIAAWNEERALRFLVEQDERERRRAA